MRPHRPMNRREPVPSRRIPQQRGAGRCDVPRRRKRNKECFPALGARWASRQPARHRARPTEEDCPVVRARARFHTRDPRDQCGESPTRLGPSAVGTQPGPRKARQSFCQYREAVGRTPAEISTGASAAATYASRRCDEQGVDVDQALAALLRRRSCSRRGGVLGDRARHPARREATSCVHRRPVGPDAISRLAGVWLVQLARGWGNTDCAYRRAYRVVSTRPQIPHFLAVSP